jgi:biopolymer transport protein ExbB
MGSVMTRRIIRLLCLASIVAATASLTTGTRAQQPAVGAAPVQVPAQNAPIATPQAVSPAPSSVPVETPTPVTAVSPGIGPLQELSPWSMFLAADDLVKAVMIGLAFASFVTWTLFFAKSAQLYRARRRLKNALAKIIKARSLDEAQVALGRKPNVLAALVSAATQEIELSRDDRAGIKERAASRFSEIQRSEASAARRGMGLIATIGATAPFVGLFGTVWGIMNSFIGISKAQTTNLAVVAPGIAEALLATAIGLAAAIPAVIIYNHFSRGTKSYIELVGRGVGTVGRLLSRDLEAGQRTTIEHAAE